MMRLNSFLALVCLLLFSGCGGNSDKPGNDKPDTDSVNTSDGDLPSWKAAIRQMSDDSYPDNPDIEIRHPFYDQPVYKDIVFKKLGSGNYDVVCTPKTENTDELAIRDINVMEFIPLIVEQVRGDKYASYVSIINQEWNRHQVRFGPDKFTLTGGKEKEKIVRVDLARNCLNAYLWELIVYAEDKADENKVKPYYHGWFNFDKELYSELFKQRNGGEINFEDYSKYLVDWVTPENKYFDLSLLRAVGDEEEIEFETHNKKLYTIVGERKKKQKNIISPKKFKNIDDFLHDYTRFATFTPPGYYNTEDPRPTELSRFAILDLVKRKVVTSTNSEKTRCYELEMQFKRRSDDVKTKFIIGGIEPDKIPTLSVAEAHKGWQMSMGISNHSFYEDYQTQQDNPAAENPFYAMLMDQNDNWLDSHMIGTDGPLFHYDEKDENLVHLWLLSFERHAFVGHFTFELPKEIPAAEG